MNKQWLHKWWVKWNGIDSRAATIINKKIGRILTTKSLSFNNLLTSLFPYIPKVPRTFQQGPCSAENSRKKLCKNSETMSCYQITFRLSFPYLIHESFLKLHLRVHASEFINLLSCFCHPLGYLFWKISIIFVKYISHIFIY